jgi:hypothetical protein
MLLMFAQSRFQVLQISLHKVFVFLQKPNCIKLQFLFNLLLYVLLPQSCSSSSNGIVHMDVMKESLAVDGFKKFVNEAGCPMGALVCMPFIKEHTS